MTNTLKKYNLNFNLVATPKEEISNKFIKMDQAIYGKLKGITDKNRYTNSFHIPEGYRISTEDKIKIEAQYHSLTNGGHIANCANKKWRYKGCYKCYKNHERKWNWLWKDS